MKSQTSSIKKPSYKELRKELNVNLILIGLAISTTALFLGILSLIK